MREIFLNLAENSPAPASAAHPLHLKPRSLHDNTDILPVPARDASVRDAIAAIGHGHQPLVAVVSAQHIAAVDGKLEQAVEYAAVQLCVG